MSGLRRRLRELWQTIVHEHTSPARVAAAILVGAIVGCTPLFGTAWYRSPMMSPTLGSTEYVPIVPVCAFADVR